MLIEFNVRPFVAQGYLDLGELYANNDQADSALKTWTGRINVQRNGNGLLFN